MESHRHSIIESLFKTYNTLLEARLHLHAPVNSCSVSDELHRRLDAVDIEQDWTLTLCIYWRLTIVETWKFVYVTSAGLNSSHLRGLDVPVSYCTLLELARMLPCCPASSEGEVTLTCRPETSKVKKLARVLSYLLFSGPTGSLKLELSYDYSLLKNVARTTARDNTTPPIVNWYAVHRLSFSLDISADSDEEVRAPFEQLKCVQDEPEFLSLPASMGRQQKTTQAEANCNSPKADQVWMPFESACEALVKEGLDKADSSSMLEEYYLCKSLAESLC
jgi:hypothetical protein